MRPDPPDLCPYCDYLLTGIENVSQCPECGSARLQDQIILLGRAPGIAALVTHVTMFQFSLALLIGTFSLILRLATTSSSPLPQELWIGLLFCIFTVINGVIWLTVTVSTLRGWRNPNSTRVYLGPTGATLREGRKTRSLPWGPKSDVRIFSGWMGVTISIRRSGTPLVPLALKAAELPAAIDSIRCMLDLIPPGSHRPTVRVIFQKPFLPWTPSRPEIVINARKAEAEL